MQSRLPLSSTQFKPEDITLDVRKQLVYVIGTKGSSKSGTKAVVRSKYDGSQAEEVLNIDQPDSEVYGFGVLGQLVILLEVKILSS